MKIAISSQGNGLNSQMDPRFGRAKSFVIYDTETKNYQDVSNTQNLQATQGAGIQAAKTVIDSGAEILITGNVGPKAFSTLNSAGVKIFIGESGTVSNMINNYINNELKMTDGANVEGHW